MEDEIQKVRTHLTVPVWPTTGRVMGLGKNAVYAAVKSGEIPSLKIGGRIVVPTAPLRRMLGIGEAA